MSDLATDVIVTADIGGYSQSMQSGVSETNKLISSLQGLSQSVDAVHQKASRRLTIIDASVTAGLAGAAAAAAKFEDQLSQLEGRSVMTGQKFAQHANSVKALRREYGMAADSAIQLVTAMNSMGAKSNQTQQLAQSYVKLSAVTGESVTGLAQEQNQFMRSMNSGRIPSAQAVNRYSSMSANLSQSEGVSATGTLQFANQISPLAKQSGMNQQDIMGFSTAFGKAGQDGGAASTAFNRVLSSVNTSRQWGTEDYKKYAAFAGMSPEQFKKAPIKDSMIKILEKMGQDGPEGSKFMEEMGLDTVRTKNAITALSQGGGLSKTIDKAYKSYGDTEGFEKGSKEALSGLNEEVRKAGQTFATLAESVGAIVLPALTKGAELFNTIVGGPLKSFADLLGKIPGPMKDMISGLLAAAIAAKTIAAVGGIGKVVGGVGTAAAALQLTKTGAFAQGFKKSRDPSRSNDALDWLESGDAPGSQTWMYGAGQKAGAFNARGSMSKISDKAHDLGKSSTGWFRNPTKDADDSKSDATRRNETILDARHLQDGEALKKEAKAKLDAEREVSATQPSKLTPRVVAEVQAVSPVSKDATDSLGKATKSLTDVTKAMSPETESEKLGLGARARRGANWLMGGANNLYRDSLSPAIDGDKSLEKTARNALWSSQSKDEFLDKRAFRKYGYEAKRFGGDPERGMTAEWMVGQDETRSASGKPIRNLDRSLKWAIPAAAGEFAATTGKAVAGTAAQGLKAAAGGIGGFIAANPMMLGVTAATGAFGWAANEASKVKERNASFDLTKEANAVQAPTDRYREALGEATAAVKTFAESLKEGTPRWSASEDKTIDSAMKISQEESDQYSGKKEYIEDSGVRHLSSEKDLVQYAANAFSRTQTPGGINAVQAELLANTGNKDLVESITKQAWDQISGSTGVNDYFSIENPKFGAGLFNKKRANNDEVQKEAATEFKGARSEVQDLYGKNAADDMAKQSFIKLLGDGQDPYGANRNLEGNLKSYVGALGGKTDGKEFFDLLTKTQWAVDETADKTWYGSKTVNSGAASEKTLAALDEYFKSKNIGIDVDLSKRTDGAFTSSMAAPPVANAQSRTQATLDNAKLGDNAFSNILLGSGNEKLLASIDLPGNAALLGQATRAGTGSLLANSGGLTDDGFLSANKELAEFVTRIANASSGMTQLSAAVLASIQQLQQITMSAAGQTGIQATSQFAVDQFDLARNVRAMNQDDAQAEQNYQTQGQNAVQAKLGLDNYFQGAAKEYGAMERGFSASNRGLVRSQDYQKEQYQLQQGYQREDRTQSLGWQEDAFQLSKSQREDDFARSRKLQQDDFNRQRSYQFEDFNRSRKREEANWNLQRNRQEEDYNRSLLRNAESYNRSKARQDEDYNRSRRREEVEHNFQVEKMAKDSAKRIFDVYSRVGTERTWSLQGMLANMADQQRMLDEQIENLKKARKLGLTDQTIEVLGLADSSKAQQLQRIVDDLSMGAGTAADVNKGVNQRIGAAGKIGKDPSNAEWVESERRRKLGLEQQEEDYNRSNSRTEEDRKRALKEGEEDYRRSRKNQGTDRALANEQMLSDNKTMLDRQNAAFKLGNKNSLDEFNKQTGRINAAHSLGLVQSNTLYETSVKRSNSAFKEGLKKQRSDLVVQMKETIKAFNDRMSDWSISTDDAVKLLGGTLTGGAKITHDALKGTYDLLDTRVKNFKGLIGSSWTEAGMGVPGTILPGGPSVQPGQGTPKPGESKPGSPRPMHQGGPGHGSDVAAAALLGGATHSGGSGKSQPVQGSVTQGFGHDHPGVDIAGRIGDSIKAAMGGTVAYSGNAGAYGNLTKIAHDNGMETWYGHQSIQNVSRGDKVDAGQEIGRVGDTGRSSGAHAHIELRHNGNAVDPSGMFAGAADGDGGIGGPGNLEAVMKKRQVETEQAFRLWEAQIDRVPRIRSLIQRNATVKYWNKKTQDRYYAKYPEEDPKNAGKYDGSGAVGVFGQSFTAPGGGGYVWPTTSKTLSGNYSGHSGVDIAVRNAPIFAVADGRIVGRQHLSGSFGNYVKMQDKSGKYWMYGHNSSVTIGDGAQVSRGQRLGTSGNTGNVRGASGGYHLHIEASNRNSFGAAGNRNLTLGLLRNAPLMGTSAASNLGKDTGSVVGSGVGSKNNGPMNGSLHSENGWPTLPNGHPSLVPVPHITGTSRPGSVNKLLSYVTNRFDATVENINRGDSYGHLFRKIAGSNSYSNHASGTAVDINASKHAMGRVNTFSKVDVAAIRGILAAAGGAIKWGGDYRGRKDDMHFEIQGGAGAVDHAASRLRGAGYAGGTSSAGAGIREVGEHGMEIIFGKSLRKFAGGEQVLNPLQTRQAALGIGTSGVTPAVPHSNAPSSVHYDHSMRVEHVTVVANDPSEMYKRMEDQQRLRALTGGTR